MSSTEPHAGSVDFTAANLYEGFTFMTRVHGMKDVRLTLEETRKACLVCVQLKAAGYEENQIVSLVLALFGPFDDVMMMDAFNSFDINQNGKISAEEFLKAVPLMGERLTLEQTEELFKQADANTSGELEYREFCAVVKGLNPKGEEGYSLFDAFRNATAEAINTSGIGGVASVPNDLANAMDSITSAYAADLGGVGLLKTRKAGKLYSQMIEAGWSDEKAKANVNAYLGQQQEQELRDAFQHFDSDGSGLIDKTEFRTQIPVMHEGDILHFDVDEMFAKFDTDNSGKISFEEFAEVVKTLHPQEGGVLESLMQMFNA